jgi:FlaA1/EpsC-like NDP-sugar epimerase
MNVEDLLYGWPVINQQPMDYYKGKKCLVTGACGSIGSEVLKQLVEQKADVVGLDWNEWAVVQAREKGLPVNLGDVQHTFPLGEYVFHCAAYKHVNLGESFKEIYDFNNYHMTKLLSESFAGKLVLASTDKAAGSSVMGQSKWFAEQQLLYDILSKKRRRVAVRLVNCIGSQGSVVWRWKERLTKHEKPKICPRSVRRYWMQVSDAAYVLLVAGQMDSGVYTVHGMPEFSMGDLLEAFLTKNHKQKEWFEEIPLAENEAEKENLIRDGEHLVDTGVTWLKKIEI